MSIVCEPSRPTTYRVRRVQRNDRAREGFALRTGFVPTPKRDTYWHLGGQRYDEESLGVLMTDCLRQGISLEVSA